MISTYVRVWNEQPVNIGELGDGLGRSYYRGIAAIGGNLKILPILTHFSSKILHIAKLELKKRQMSFTNKSIYLFI